MTKKRKRKSKKRGMGKGFSKDGTDSKQTAGVDRKVRSRWKNLRTYQPAKVSEDDPTRGEWVSIGSKKKKSKKRRRNQS